MQRRTYSAEDYPFVHLVEKILGTTPLSLLHEQLNSLPALVEHKTDQGTELHRLYYSRQDIMLGTFARFVKGVIRPLFKEDILYQKRPTFRVQLPNNLSVGAFHKDADYSHDPHEVNFLVALTSCFDTNTLWIESIPGKKDYTPINIEVGEFITFSGANLEHGNKVNKTGLTRVSFDFRVLSKRFYNPDNVKKTTNVGMRMLIGEYFDVC